MASGQREAQETARDPAGSAELLASRLRGGVSRLAAQAGRGAKRVKHAARDLRQSPTLQHALAARERGNLEAAFWLLNEEFTTRPDEPAVALHYWDVALCLGRVDIASGAGVQLIERCAADAEPELAAQHWIELIKEAPDVLVSPAALATILPALKARVSEMKDDAADDRQTFRGYLRRSVRHAVDPKNSGLHPGVALRIFEEGRDINPEAARRAAEAALESPNLHEAKRERLEDWLAGKSVDARERPTPPTAPVPLTSEEAEPARLSTAEIKAAAARLPPAKSTDEPETHATAEPPPTAGPAITAGQLRAIDEEGLVVEGVAGGRLSYAQIEAVAVAEILGIEDAALAVVDLITNWTRRDSEPLSIVRLRIDQLDLGALVTRKHALGSDFAAVMGDIMERTSAIPLPDPESALGTRITCFDSVELYERVGLRVAA